MNFFSYIRDGIEKKLDERAEKQEFDVEMA